MYIPVKCGETNIAAVIDTGSSINILSINLFNSLPENSKSRIYPFHEEIKLANGHHIKIIGTADLKIRTDKMHTIKTYLLLKTSHPMILGMNYLRSKHISIIFKEFPSGNNYKIKADRRLLIANSELVIWDQLEIFVCMLARCMCK
jgi:predicted aspartyl protease